MTVRLRTRVCVCEKSDHASKAMEKTLQKQFRDTDSFPKHLKIKLPQNSPLTVTDLTSHRVDQLRTRSTIRSANPELNFHSEVGHWCAL